MLLTSEAQELPQDDGPRRFIVNMMARGDGAPEIRSCEIVGKRFRNRTSFRKNAQIDDVFIEVIASGLQDCLSKLSGGNEVIALPSFVLQVPGLLLAGAHIMMKKVTNGTHNIIVRFRFFLGGINRAFLPNIGFDQPVKDHNTHLSTAVLSEIAMPLLNICAAAETGLMNAGQGLQKFGSNLAERSHEIRFQIELVRRYVEQQERLSSAASAPHLRLPDDSGFDIDIEVEADVPDVTIQ